MPIDPTLRGQEAREAIINQINQNEATLAAVQGEQQRQAVELADLRRDIDETPALELPAVAERAWGDFDPSILPPDEAKNHHNEVVAWLPMREFNDDRTREIIRVWGWNHGTTPDYNAGYRLENRQRLVEGLQWTQHNARQFLIRGNRIFGRSNASDALPWTADPWAVDLTDDFEFSAPIGIDPTLPGSGIFPYIDASGAADGETIGWFQVTNDRGTDSRYETVIAYQGEPYISHRGGLPPKANDGWLRIHENGTLTSNGFPYDRLRFQRSVNPAEVFPG